MPHCASACSPPRRTARALMQKDELIWRTPNRRSVLAIHVHFGHSALMQADALGVVPLVPGSPGSSTRRRGVVALAQAALVTLGLV